MILNSQCCSWALPCGLCSCFHSTLFSYLLPILSFLLCCFTILLTNLSILTEMVIVHLSVLLMLQLQWISAKKKKKIFPSFPLLFSYSVFVFVLFCFTVVEVVYLYICLTCTTRCIALVSLLRSTSMPFCHLSPPIISDSIELCLLLQMEHKHTLWEICFFISENIGLVNILWK